MIHENLVAPVDRGYKGGLQDILLQVWDQNAIQMQDNSIQFVIFWSKM